MGSATAKACEGAEEAGRGRSLSQRIGKAIRSNALGLVAVYLAIGGTALALPGKNTVNSGDIENGEVKGADVDEATLAIPWAGLTGVPAGFVDGVDNVGTGSGGDATDLHCPAACIEANEIGQGQIVGSALNLPFGVAGTPPSGPLVDITNNGGANTRALRATTTGAGIGLAASAGGDDGWGVHATASGSRGIGVEAVVTGDKAVAVRAKAEEKGAAISGLNPDADSIADGFAGFFLGRVVVVGTLTKSAGSFRIDHPLDPANQYLQHSFVESPDMMNIYNGVVRTDGRGSATVRMPDWFQGLNRSFRYQLTPLHSFARAMVSRELKGNSFDIRTSKPQTKVSWQVTGIRHDAYAKENRIEVEVPKRGEERGAYLYPEGFGEPRSRGIGYQEAASK